MTVNPVKTWAEVTRQSEAYEDILRIVAAYFRPNSTTPPEIALSDIAGVIDIKGGQKLTSIERPCSHHVSRSGAKPASGPADDSP